MSFVPLHSDMSTHVQKVKHSWLFWYETRQRVCGLWHSEH